MKLLGGGGGDRGIRWGGGGGGGVNRVEFYPKEQNLTY
jgi:hypothetical protein